MTATMNAQTTTPAERQENSMPRRSFLGRAVAALAAGATANLTAIAATRPPAAAIAEHPALIDAGQRIDAAQAEHRTAAALWAEARELAEKLCPPIPDELVCKGPLYRGCTEYETDVEGKNVWPRREDGCRPPRNIFNSVRAEDAIKRGNLTASKRTKFGRKIHGMIKIAKQYEAERAAAIERSGLPDQAHRMNSAAFELQTLARDVAEIEPLTLMGALVQARALCAYTEAEQDSDKRWAAGIVGLSLARSVSRLVG